MVGIVVSNSILIVEFAHRLRETREPDAGKAVALAAKVPVVPGTKGDITTDVSKEVAEIGYPVLIKASAGGGG